MRTDEHLIADLASSLRQALSYIQADAGLDSQDVVLGTLTSEHAGVKRTFNGADAVELLAVAATRFATMQPHPPSLELRISITHAEQLSEGMSDLLCWCAGFSAAVSHEPDRHPYGVDDVRTMRMELRDAIARARGRREEEWTF